VELAPTYARWMKLLGVAAVISTAVSEIYERKLVAGFEMPDWLAALVSYISFASVSMLLVGGVLGSRHLMAMTMESGPTSASTRVSRKPAFFIH
jgi:hypothetical protein